MYNRYDEWLKENGTFLNEGRRRYHALMTAEKRDKRKQGLFCTQRELFISSVGYPLGTLGMRDPIARLGIAIKNRDYDARDYVTSMEKIRDRIEDEIHRDKLTRCLDYVVADTRKQTERLDAYFEVLKVKNDANEVITEDKKILVTYFTSFFLSRRTSIVDLLDASYSDTHFDLDDYLRRNPFLNFTDPLNIACESELKNTSSDKTISFVTNNKNSSTSPLKNYPFDIIETEAMGDCFFIAAGNQLQLDALSLRNEVADEMMNQREEYEPFIEKNIELYVSSLRKKGGEWGEHVTLQIVDKKYKRPVVVLMYDDLNSERPVISNFSTLECVGHIEALQQPDSSLKPIWLLYHPRRAHYEELRFTGTDLSATIKKLVDATHQYIDAEKKKTAEKKAAVLQKTNLNKASELDRSNTWQDEIPGGLQQRLKKSSEPHEQELERNKQEVLSNALTLEELKKQYRKTQGTGGEEGRLLLAQSFGHIKRLNIWLKKGPQEWNKEDKEIESLLGDKKDAYKALKAKRLEARTRVLSILQDQTLALNAYIRTSNELDCFMESIFDASATKEEKGSNPDIAFFAPKKPTRHEKLYQDVIDFVTKNPELCLMIYNKKDDDSNNTELLLALNTSKPGTPSDLLKTFKTFDAPFNLMRITSNDETCSMGIARIIFEKNLSCRLEFDEGVSDQRIVDLCNTINEFQILYDVAESPQYAI